MTDPVTYSDKHPADAVILGAGVDQRQHLRDLTPAQHPIARTKPTLSRRLVGIAGGSLLLYVAWAGATGFVRQWPQATGVGQIAQTSGELVYAVGALLCVLTTLRARRWAAIARRVWIVGATVAGGLAPTVWGGAPIWLSVITSVASVGVAVGLVWMLRRGFPLNGHSTT